MELLSSVNDFMPLLELRGSGRDSRATAAYEAVSTWVHSGKPGTAEFLPVWRHMDGARGFLDNWREYYQWMCYRQRERWFLDLATVPGWATLEISLPKDAPNGVKRMLLEPYRQWGFSPPDPDTIIIGREGEDLVEFDERAAYLEQHIYTANLL
jgi:hypothetical protein